MRTYRFVLAVVIMITCGLTYAKCLSQSYGVCRLEDDDPWCAEHGNGNLYAYSDGCLKAQPSKSFTQSILNAANAVLAAFQNKDSKTLAAFVHPTKGVRFSPDFTVNITTDRVLSSTDILRFWTDPKIYYWGSHDHFDEGVTPIRLRPSEYCEHYVLTGESFHDLLVKVNEPFGSGHRNLEGIYMELTYMFKAYPGTTWVEYTGNVHQNIRLVFERVRKKWFLVGVLWINYIY